MPAVQLPCDASTLARALARVLIEPASVLRAGLAARAMALTLRLNDLIQVEVAQPRAFMPWRPS
jgi:hypothetical protein